MLEYKRPSASMYLVSDEQDLQGAFTANRGESSLVRCCYCYLVFPTGPRSQGTVDPTRSPTQSLAENGIVTPSPLKRACTRIEGGGTGAKPASDSDRLGVKEHARYAGEKRAPHCDLQEEFEVRLQLFLLLFPTPFSSRQ